MQDMAVNKHTHSVLVVDGDAKTFHAIRDNLGKVGYEVHLAANTWEAQRQLRENHFDLIVSDLVLPDMDGVHFRQKIAGNWNTRSIPFIFLVDDDPVASIRALESGVDDCITVPLEPSVFVARVQAIFRRRNAYDAAARLDLPTGLLNAEAIETEVTRELARITRYKRTSAIVILDVKDAAVVMSDEGRPIENQALGELAEVIRSNMRFVDMAGRPREDQFLICLPETDRQSAKGFLERIKKGFQEAASAKNNPIPSIYAGVVLAPEDSDDFDMLLQHASDATACARRDSGDWVALWNANAIAERN